MPNHQVTIIRTTPIVSEGIARTLDQTEFDIVPVDESELSRWTREGGLVISSVRCGDDVQLVRELREAVPSAKVVALVQPSSPQWIRAGLEAGATSVILLDAETRSIVLALRAALAQLAVIPEAASRDLVLTSEGQEGTPLSAEELGWLADLAAGATVRDVAARAGYSPRAMFRVLGSVYRSLGAETRSGALVQAARRGLI